MDRPTVFVDAEEARFGWRPDGRLWIALPRPLWPLAAWLAGDVQRDLSHAEHYASLVESAWQKQWPEPAWVDGNACRLTRDGQTAVLESHYDQWEPVELDEHDLRAALGSLLGFLRAGRPPATATAGHPAVYMGMLQVEDPHSGRPNEHPIVHTFFPDEWSEDEVRASVQRAWSSDSLLVCPVTGYWSGLDGRLEVAGYLGGDGDPVAAFPVMPASTSE